jgi:nucleoside-diphosphate-sugar epimerase
MSHTVGKKGIFYNLPIFPKHDGKKYTIIVTGANGISGSSMVDVLAASPERWETIYAMSRKPPVRSEPNVKTIAADFLENSPEELKAIFEKEGIKKV